MKIDFRMEDGLWYPGKVGGLNINSHYLFYRIGDGPWHRCYYNTRHIAQRQMATLLPALEELSYEDGVALMHERFSDGEVLIPNVEEN